MIKTRFAPSPTGLLHLGNIRTALFSFLYAKAHAGTFLLRIEDTDQVRSQSEFTEAIFEDLRWLGLQWQEGPGCEGNVGPYEQSRRQAIYVPFYEKLLNEKHGYHCFCTEETLDMMRRIQRSMGKPSRYAGTCRNLSDEEVSKRLASGEASVLRFRVPEQQAVVFHDLVHGEQTLSTADIGDFIIRRADGSTPFLFGNAIDDVLMGVTDVWRGDDHLTNTTQQLLILQALKLQVPRYAHVPLILGLDGSPLSKRNGSRSLQSLREEGFLPQALINYLARLGHHYESLEMLSLNDLGKVFSPTHVSHACARFDLAQLLHWQKIALQKLDSAAWAAWAADDWRHVPKEKQEVWRLALSQLIAFPKDITWWTEHLLSNRLLPEADAEAILLEVDRSLFQVAGDVLQEGLALPDFFRAVSEKTGLRGKLLYQPIRAALTGCLHGPDFALLYDMQGFACWKKRFADQRG